MPPALPETIPDHSPDEPATPIDLRYPVVLAHGIIFALEATPGDELYFRGVARHLRSLGVRVLVPYVGLLNGIPDRARRLGEQIEAAFPGEKVNIIAHSMGGLDARYLISRLGFAPRVATLTTLATPHRGSTVADWTVMNITRGFRVDWLLARLGIEVTALEDLTTENLERFNQATPDAPGVRYFSYGGALPWYQMNALLIPFSWLILLRERVRAGEAIGAGVESLIEDEEWGPPLLEALRREARWVREEGPDPAESSYHTENNGANDGMVPLRSTRWGETFHTLSRDHLDQIGYDSARNPATGLYEYLTRQLAARGF